MESLIKNPNIDYHQLMERAQKYILLDDEKQAQKAEKRDEKKFWMGEEHMEIEEGGTKR